MSRKTDTPFKESSLSTAREHNMPASKATKLIRGAALSTALAFTFFASQPANAVSLRLDGVTIQIDTTLSAGVQVLTRDRNTNYLPVVNGGPATLEEFYSPLAVEGTDTPITDVNEQSNGGVSLEDNETCTTDAGNAYGQFCQRVTSVPNFDGSINTDDGRLNFDRDDLISGPLKITSELEAAYKNVTFFARASAFYDAVLEKDDNFDRSSLNDKGRTNSGRNLELLDAYVDYDGEVANLPFSIRAGRQVINWGEATFIPGGNSAFSPIDVSAIRRPGAEIKEALLPVEALYGSVALPYDLTLEAYVGGWDEFKLDKGGTAFGGSDVFTPGSTGGNPENVYFVGGGKRSGQQFACDTDALTSAGMAASAAIASAVLATGAIDCANNPNIDVLRDWTEGRAEQERYAAGDTNVVFGLANDDGSESFGLALRWYAENLNSTEFAAYYQRVDSRLPYISYKTGKAGVTASSTGYHSTEVGRGAGITGCLGLITGDATAGKLYDPRHVNTKVNDPYGLLENATIQTVASNTAAGVSAQSLSDSNALSAVTVAQANALRAAARTARAAEADGGVLPDTDEGDLPFEDDDDLSIEGAMTAEDKLAAQLAPSLAVLEILSQYQRNESLPKDSVAYLQETNCLTYLAQRDSTRTFGSAFEAGGQLPTGATNLQLDYNIGLFAEYPEVEIMGFSFNTTAFGWGVQGDFTFRPEMPLQLDTDTMTISALFNNCAFATVGALEPLYQSGATYSNEHVGEIGCTDQDRYLKGYTTDHDAYTWDIGTTATFTRSNPVISALGADLGILLTEFQGVIAEDIEEERGNTGGITALGGAKGITPLSNVCTAGSDLPLNGILSIDDRTIDNAKGYCRATDSSWGGVIFAQLQYNNVFGTPISVNPTFVYNHGIEGYSPSPLGFWREGVGSSSFRLDARYLDAWQFGLAYTSYHGEQERTRNLDRDTLAASVSYAF
jgi:hypothetical protein